MSFMEEATPVASEGHAVGQEVRLQPHSLHACLASFLPPFIYFLPSSLSFTCLFYSFFLFRFPLPSSSLPSSSLPSSISPFIFLDLATVACRAPPGGGKRVCCPEAPLKSLGCVRTHFPDGQISDGTRPATWATGAGAARILSHPG